MTVDPTVPQPIPFDVIKAMRGIDLLQAMIDGKLPPPPISKALDFRISEVSPGFAVFTCTPKMMHYNPIGSVHGGYAATLLDSACGIAVHSQLGPGRGHTTLELKVSYLRGLTDKSGQVRAVGRVTSIGRRAAFAEATLHDASGRLCATATSTLLLFDLER